MTTNTQHDETLKNNLSKVVKILWAIVKFVAFIGMVVTPFIGMKIDFTLANILFYGSVFIVVLSIFVNDKKAQDKTNPKETRKSFAKACSVLCRIYLPLVMSGIFTVLNYSTGYDWYWFGFSTFIESMIFGSIAMFIYGLKDENRTDEEKVHALGVISTKVLFFTFVDFFYIAIAKAIVWAQYVTGGLIILYIFTDMSNVFRPNRTQSTSKILLCIEFLIGVGVSIYLIVQISDQTLRDALITIVSAIFGGLLTLLGVAWTIQNEARQKRKEEQNRICPIIINKDGKIRSVKNNCIEGEKGTTLCFSSNTDDNYGISFNVKNASNNVCFIKEIVLEKCILKPINGTNFCVEGKEEFTVVLNNLSVDQLVYLAKGHIYMRILDIQGTEYSFLIKTADNQILSIEKIACSCAY